MKYKFVGFGIILLFICMLLAPQAVFNGASDGLMLWFQLILPTLFPFMLITDLMIRTDTIHYVSNMVSPFVSRIFKTSTNGSFAVVAGFLCGYPMGAKVTTDLVQTQKISLQEAKYLLSFCNNASPVFIMNFVVWKTLDHQELTVPTLLITLGVPIIMSFLFRPFYLCEDKIFQNLSSTKRVLSTNNTSVIDTCIMNSFEAITMIGGYIIIFSILLSVIQNYAYENSIIQNFLPCLEMSNGILLLKKLQLPENILYASVLGLTSFGGLCAVAQTKSIVRSIKIPILPYTTQKLVTAIVTSLIAYIYIYSVY